MRIKQLSKAELYFKDFLLNSFVTLKSAPKTEGIPEIEVSDTAVFFRLHKIGDALVSTPTIRAFKEKYGCRIVVVAEKRNWFVFKNHPDVDEVICYKKGIKGMLNVIEEVNALRPKVLINLHDRPTTTGSIIMGMIKAKYKLSIHDNRNDRLFTHTAPFLDPYKNHVVERIGAVLRPLKIYPDNTWNVVFEPSPEAINKAKSFIAQYQSTDHKVMGVNISAGSVARYWGSDNYKSLLDFLSAKKIPYILICSPDDYDLAKQIVAENKIACSNSFEEFAAIAQNITLLFTPDTSIVHLASAKSIPVFGLYVRESKGVKNWYPYRSKYDWEIASRFITEISFEDIKEKLSNFINQNF